MEEAEDEEEYLEPPLHKEGQHKKRNAKGVMDPWRLKSAEQRLHWQAPTNPFIGGMNVTTSSAPSTASYYTASAVTSTATP